MAVSNRAFPDVSCILYSNSQTPFPNFPALAICDVFSGTLVPSSGDSLKFQPAVNPNPNIAGEWYGQPGYEGNPFNLEFVRFKSDGTAIFGAKAIEDGGKEDVAGWVISPRLTMLDAKIGDNAEELGDPDTTNLNFEAIDGVWKTVPAYRKYLGTAIYNTSEGYYWEARSQGDIPKNRSLIFNVSLLGRGEDDKAEQSADPNAASQPIAVISWGSYGDGGHFRLIWEDGQPIGVEKELPQKDSETNKIRYDLPLKWQRVLSLGTDAAKFDRTRYTILVMRLAGRLVIVLNDKAYWYLEREVTPPASKNSTSDKVTPIDVDWGIGPIECKLLNARMRLEVGVIKYSLPGGQLYSGNFRRSIRRNDIITDSTVSRAFGGWSKRSSQNDSIGTHVLIETENIGGKFVYQCTLTASPDGIDTPFVSKVMLQRDAVYTRPAATSLNATGALQSIRISRSMPSRENSTGTTATVELDMKRLKDINGNMLDYATSYRKIEIRGRWQDSTGSVGNAPLMPLFQGYVTAFSDSLPGFATHTRTLRCRDASCLMQAPAGFIDHRYAPLDLFFAAKIGAALDSVNQVPNMSKAVMYGWEMVKEILRLDMGTQFVTDLQVVFPKGHFPLMSTDEDRCGYIMAQAAFGGKQAPSNNGFMFPPPYKSHLWDWVSTIAEMDSAVFFMAPPIVNFAADPMTDNRNGWPVPTYGRLQYWLTKGPRKIWVTGDNVYPEGTFGPEKTIQFLIESLDLETRADRDFNHFYAASSPPGTDMGGIMPGLRMSEAYVRKGRNIAAASWRRTRDIQNEMAWAGGPGQAGVDALVQVARNEIEGVKLQWPQITVSGEPTMYPGDIMDICRDLSNTNVPHSYASPAGYDGMATVRTRIHNLEHEISLNGSAKSRRWTTKVDLRPMLADGV